MVPLGANLRVTLVPPRSAAAARTYTPPVTSTAAAPATVTRFASLRVRNFRLFFFGQFVSVIGNWMQQVALPVVVLDRLDRGGATLGIVTAMPYAAVLPLGAFGGIIADRFDKRKLVMITQTTFFLAVALLGLLVVTDHVSLWVVIVLAGVQGAITAFDNPARQTFTHDMVGRELLTNALGLNMLAMNTGRVLGPAIAGGLLLVTDVGVLFLVNALSFLAAVVALATMRPAELHPAPPVVREKGQIRAGFLYARTNPTIRTALGMLVLVGCLSYNFPVFLPLLAKVTFEMPETRYGTFFSVMGIGAMAFALLRTTRTPTPQRLVTATAGMGFALLAIALAPNEHFVYAALPFLGMASINFLVMMNATLQLASADHMRGRVMALYTMALLGTTPFGSLLVGWVGEHMGPRHATAVGALGALVPAAGGWLVFRRRRALAQR
jgi:MFS family permease